VDLRNEGVGVNNLKILNCSGARHLERRHLEVRAVAYWGASRHNRTIDA